MGRFHIIFLSILTLSLWACTNSGTLGAPSLDQIPGSQATGASLDSDASETAAGPAERPAVQVHGNPTCPEGDEECEEAHGPNAPKLYCPPGVMPPDPQCYIINDNQELEQEGPREVLLPEPGDFQPLDSCDPDHPLYDEERCQEDSIIIFPLKVLNTTVIGLENIGPIDLNRVPEED